VLRRGISLARDGSVHVSLSPEERLLLASLPIQVEPALGSDDPSLRRLSPPAYPDDDAADAEYRGLVGSGLREGRRAALQELERTAHAETLSTDELYAWLGALETLRLVLGTQLDVTEETGLSPVDESDPDAPRLALYHWLSWLQDDVVQTLSESL
jgi:Domain of unknown function (DUF2017)